MYREFAFKPGVDFARIFRPVPEGLSSKYMYELVLVDTGISRGFGDRELPRKILRCPELVRNRSKKFQKIIFTTETAVTGGQPATRVHAEFRIHACMI